MSASRKGRVALLVSMRVGAKPSVHDARVAPAAQFSGAEALDLLGRPAENDVRLKGLLPSLAKK